MSEPTLEEQAAAFLAWKLGEAIEGKKDGGEWWPILPNYELSRSTTIRLIAKPKLRPWTNEEIPPDAWYRHVGATACYRSIAACDIYGVEFVTFSLQFGQFTAAKMFAELQHSTDGGKTWKPCGVVSE